MTVSGVNVYVSEQHCSSPAVMRGERGEKTGTYSGM